MEEKLYAVQAKNGQCFYTDNLNEAIEVAKLSKSNEVLYGTFGNFVKIEINERIDWYD